MTTGIIVGIVLMVLTTPIQYMPKAVLASVVFLIGIELIDISGLRRILRRRAEEFVVATLVAVVVVTVGVEQGIILAIVASIIDHLRRSYHPHTAVMQKSGVDQAWHGVDVGPDVRTQPGLVIYRFAGSLYYANASRFSEQVSAFITRTDPPEWICIDASAMPDIDFSGGETIRQLQGSLSARSVRLAVAEPMKPVRDELDRDGLTQVLGADFVFPTLQDAVDAFDARSPSSDPGS